MSILFSLSLIVLGSVVPAARKAEDAGRHYREVLAGACSPEAGDCCSNNGSPGCDDVACCQSVCANDPFCCSVNWDSGCAEQAVEICEGLVCGEASCPPDAMGNCCLANASPGCEDESCCAATCAIDPFCCESNWDEQCATQAQQVCGVLCEGNSCPPSLGSCCLSHGTPGCSDTSCCSTVCSLLPECCEVGWSTACAELAETSCGCLPPEPMTCPESDGDCCSAHQGVGCESQCCCELVCNNDPGCCDVEWTSHCAAQASELCMGTCDAMPACPGTGSCFLEGTTPGCRKPSCCSLVCDLDSFCCDVRWDASCVGIANEYCSCVSINGDCNEDRNVDENDHPCFSDCSTGPGCCVLGDCGNFDLDGDNDIDLYDWSVYQSLIGEP